MASICSSSFRRMYILSMAGFMSLRERPVCILPPT